MHSCTKDKMKGAKSFYIFCIVFWLNVDKKPLKSEPLHILILKYGTISAIVPKVL